MKKSVWLTLVSLIILAAFPLASHASAPLASNWRVEYYNNSSLSGHPIMSIVESTINHNWGFGSPNIEVPHDHFSARWTATNHFERGTYLFILTVDDGARVWLNGDLIIDAWNIGPKRERTARVRIEEAGDYEIQVAYFEYTGKAVLKLETLQLGGEDDIVGAWRGEYFNNRHLEGDPTVIRQDGGIFFSWDYGSPMPKLAQDNFSVRWTRSIFLDKPGYYLFRMQHDDGMRVYVDGKIIYDSWFDQAVTYQVRKIPLKSGYRTFTVEYYEHTGLAVAQLSIEPDPGDYSQDGDEPGEVGVVVDTSEIGFKWGGPAGNRFVNIGGYGQNLYSWTLNTGDIPINYGRWRAPIGAAGNYEVFAYIPAEHSTTTHARYFINHFGKVDQRTINQNNYADEFVSLGTYYFDGGGNEFITLRDNTGEGPSTTEIAFDAIKFVKR